VLNRLTKLFENKRENLLTVYFTAGYPKLDDTETIICSLAESGANIIEIGIPYSDPLADGPVIQESGMAAIEGGMTLQVLFNQLTDIRTKTQVPLILMGYFNQLLQYGVDKFLDDCVKTGIDGLIIPDLPLMEYEQFYKDKLTQRNISISFLITPQTEESRIHQLIGFGISDRESYLTASKYANGAIIGSAFIKHLKGKNEVDKATADFINLILNP